MHSDLWALLEAVKDHPHDDTPRLILADLLEETGRDDAERARAEFIRMQCRRARFLAGASDNRAAAAQPEYQALKAKEDSLRRAHLTSWLGVWRPWVRRPDNEEFWFQRGLLRPWVEDLKWLEELPQGPAAWAWVDGINTSTLAREEVVRLAASPVLRHLNALGFGPNGIGSEVGSIGPEGARVLAGSPHLTRLTHLDLRDCVIGPEGAKALAESSNLSRVTFLDLGGWDCTAANGIGDEGVRALATSSHLCSLSHLDLSENRITADGMRAIAQSRCLSGLTYLELGNNPIGLEGARALAGSPFLTQVKYIGLELIQNSPWSTNRVNEDESTEATDLLRHRFGAAVRFHAPSR